ncbi:TATA box-binding protein-like 1 [Schistocerca gregaria]|uniref:TATA box-binding protein-like 1 n=1 Tax=Schistocerca cancellata TaxID=274614 RepID=UPI002118A10D|nr:TATA box-binding protein-like 1 [Schistocerca cancellata]XP_049854749.1 TATA box-binding protein-like 1 [Schistocerca gregaria]
MMAAAIQENGLQLLPNGNLAHNIGNVEPETEPDGTSQRLMPAEGPQQPVAQAENQTDSGETPEIDIVINNVVCSFSVRCHLNLRQIALNGANVEYRKENGMITMKLRKPYTTASMWSSGKITCTGATSEEQAKIAARRFARCLQKLGFNTRFNNFRVVNVLGTCSMPFAIKITAFSERYKETADYEPELHPGVTYKLKQPKATLKIFSTGSITVTAPSVADVQAAIERIFPLVYEFRKERTKEDLLAMEWKRRGQKRKRSYTHIEIEEPDGFEDPLMDTEDDDENYDSEKSWD